MLKLAIEDGVRKSLENDAQLAAYDRSKLAAALGKAKIALDEVRTTRDDPDSSRKFCDAKLSIRFPDGIIRIIDEARSSADLEHRQGVANRAGLTHDATGFTTPFEYSVQPTDDGKKLIAESTGNDSLSKTLVELFASYLLSDEIRAAKIEIDKAEAERLANEKALATESEAAERQLSEVTLEEATAENRLAAQQLAAVWKAIPIDTRKRLAPMQTSWNKRVSAECTVEASGQSTDPMLVRAGKLRCESRALSARAGDLERYAVYNQDDDYHYATDAAAAASEAAKKM